MEFSHVPVLCRASIEALNVRPDGIYVDGTAGGAGHAAEIAKRLTSGKLIALDRDPDAVFVASERLSGLPATVVQSNFSDMDEVLDKLGIELVNGVLLDLGVSSWQLDQTQRGFSYHTDAPLDMRMSKAGTSAADLVNTLSAESLADLFSAYGEERFAWQIAQQVVRQRQAQPIQTTAQLSALISRTVPAKYRRDGHPARKCFQALRIAVNCELEHLEKGLRVAFERLKKDGVLAVITFHSLEDRIVKRFFAQCCKSCVCPPDLPVCVCGKTPRAALALKKPIGPDAQEVAQNPRSRSAKLRALRKL